MPQLTASLAMELTEAGLNSRLQVRQLHTVKRFFPLTQHCYMLLAVLYVASCNMHWSCTSTQYRLYCMITHYVLSM
jgi:hypothetical protein